MHRARTRALRICKRGEASLIIRENSIDTGRSLYCDRHVALWDIFGFMTTRAF